MIVGISQVTLEELAPGSQWSICVYAANLEDEITDFVAVFL